MSKKGFTYLELLVALAVILPVIFGVIFTSFTTLAMNEASHHALAAIHDGNQVIEQIRNTSQTGNFPSNVASAFPNGAAVAGYTNLLNEQVVVSYANPNQDPLNVTVTVTWREGNRTLTRQLVTVVTKR